MVSEAAENTDDLIWRRGDESIHVTKGDGISINVGGRVIVKPLAEWHALAESEGFDFISVFEAWGAREANLTATIIDLVMAAAMVKLGNVSATGEGEISITSAELRDIAENWDISREETASGWSIRIKDRNMDHGISTEMSSAQA